MPPPTLPALANAASPPAILVRKYLNPSRSEGPPDILSLKFPLGSNTSNAGIPRIPNFCINALPPGASALRCTLTNREFTHSPTLPLDANFSSLRHAGHQGAEISTNINRLLALASVAALAISDRQSTPEAFAHKYPTCERAIRQAWSSARLKRFISPTQTDFRFFLPQSGNNHFSHFSTYRGKMKEIPQKHCSPTDYKRFGGGIFLSAAVLLAAQPTLAQNSNSQARMSQMLNQFEQGKRPTYTTSGGGRSMGGASGMPGYANMMSGRRPSNMGGYAGSSGRGGSSQMLQLMKQKMARMQSGGGGGGGSLLQMMRQRQGGAPNMMPGMGGGPGAGAGMQSGLFAKMMQQDKAFNANMQRNQMSQGISRHGMMGGMKRPGMGMGMPGGMGMQGMGMSGMKRPGAGMSGGMPGGMQGGILGRMTQPKMNAPRAGSPFAPKQAAPAKSGTMSDLERQMESQYGK